MRPLGSERGIALLHLLTNGDIDFAVSFASEINDAAKDIE
jgi:hypothetical protein